MKTRLYKAFRLQVLIYILKTEKNTNKCISAFNNIKKVLPALKNKF